MAEDSWHDIRLAPADEEVLTKIDDEHGERMLVRLTRRGSLWYTDPDPSKGMYVYYTPTHWRRETKEK